MEERGIQSVSVYGEMSALGERLGSLVYSASEFATGRFSFGVSHSVLLFESGKKNKNTRHYNPKMFLSVLIFQYLALHKCATLLIQLLNKGLGWQSQRSDADLVFPVTVTTRFEQQVYRWQRKVQKMLLKSQHNLFTPIYGASYSCQILI